VDNEGWIVNGGETGTLQPLVQQGSLIITNTPKNHREIAGLLRKLREIRAMQINVECRFLLVNQDFFEQIGFDLDIYFNANNAQVRNLRGGTGNPGLLASDFFNFSSNAPGLGRTVPGRFSTAGNTAAPALDVPANTGWSPIGVGGNSLGIAQTVVPRSANWGDIILSRAPALGIAGQFLDDVQVDFLVKATQADRRSVQLTAPRLTFTNGQIANVYVATQVAFVSDLQPIVGDSAVGFQPTVAVATEGVTLLVEGTITADRRYVTMTVDTGISRINGFAQQPVSAIAGGQLVNSASVQSFIQLPQTTVTRVRTTVTVPDQGTLLLGGQRLVTEYEVESGVPVLSKIPILNRFFTNRIESKEEQTLMVLMKPTILIQNEEEEKNFPGLLQSLGVGGGR
jgi:general secretion pathway protein D